MTAVTSPAPDRVDLSALIKAYDVRGLVPDAVLARLLDRLALRDPVIMQNPADS